MQIILSRTECEIIFESLITELREAMVDQANDDRRGRDLKYTQKRIDEVKAVQERLLPYVA